MEAGLRLNDWMGGQRPFLQQCAFLLAPHKEVLYGGSTKGGKALSVDTLLPTPTGWVTMGAVQVGDWLLDDQGQPCRVTATSPVMYDHDVFDVEFDDGNIIRADGDHLWVTLTVTERATRQRHTEAWRAARRATRPARGTGKRPDLALRNTTQPYQYKAVPVGTTRTTRDLRATLLHRGRPNHTVALCAPLDLPELPLPIDPYVLGVWLGDGYSAGGGIASADQEIVDAVAAAGVPIHKRSGPFSYGTFGLTTPLRKLNLLHNKHIPRMYLRASREQRWALLQGLMDTDGTVNPRGQCEFCVVRRDLAEDVLELLHSLGIRTRFRTSRAVLHGKDCGERYRLKFMSVWPVFRLSRKLERQINAPREDRISRQHRTIVDVRPVPTEPVKCVTVDSPTHLYLAGRAMVPTHNSSALLMAALQYVDFPYYNALILHRTFTDLSKGDALIPRFREWTDGKGVKWDDENHAGIFPSGAKVSFGFIDTVGAERRYKGPNYQFIGWEELTEQPFAAPYTFLFSRLSRPADSQIPLRVRATTNPDGPGHDWVKLRWGLGHDDAGNLLPRPPATRLFIPSSLEDNPHVDQAAVEEALKNLDDVTYAQVRRGNWDVAAQGDLFAPERIRVVDRVPESLVLFRCRAWDKAATADGGAYTVGLRMVRVAAGAGWPEWVVEDIVRGQWSSERREAVIAQTMQRDPLGTRDAGQVATLHLIEQEPGSGGKESAELTVKANPGIWIEIMRPTGDKITRVRPYSAQVNAYNVGMVRADWNGPYLAELAACPRGVRWDQLDTSGMAHNRMALAVAPALPEGDVGVMRELPAGYRS